MSEYVFECKECKHRWEGELKEDELRRPIMPECPKCGGGCIIVDFLKGVFSI